MPPLSHTIKNYDLLTPLSSEFRLKTVPGGILSLSCLLTVLYLTYISFSLTFLTLTHTTSFKIQSSLHPTLPLTFSLTFPSLRCNIISIGSTDLNGQEQSLHLSKIHHVYKRRLNDKGFPIGGRKKSIIGGTFKDVEDVKLKLGLENVTETNDVVENEEEKCGDCYGAGEDGECCDTCDDVRRGER